MENTLTKMQRLYEAGNYTEAVSIAVELAKEDKADAKVNMVAACCALRLSEGYEDQSFGQFEKLVMIALDKVDNFDEFVELSEYYRNELCTWSKERQLKYLADFDKNRYTGPKNAAEYVLKENMNLNNTKRSMEMSSKFLANVIRVASEKIGVNEEEIQADIDKVSDPDQSATQKITAAANKAFKEYPIKDNGKECRDEVERALFDMSMRTFVDSAQDLINNNTVTGDDVKAKTERWYRGVVFPVIDMEFMVPKENAGEDDIRLERLTSLVDVYCLQLKLKVCRNRQYTYLISGDFRMKNIGKLKKACEDIKKLKPDYVAPDLSEIMNPNPVQPKKSGCYVATCVYGSYDCAQVWTLRRFRDDTLAKTWYGRAFIRTYYAISPTLVKLFGETKWFSNMCKPTLDRMVAKLNRNGVADTPYKDRNW